MAYILFDCTQFVSFDFKVEADMGIELRSLESLGYEILTKPQIESIKTEMLEKHFCSNVFEVVNDEFLADFQDWINVERIPNSIYKFSELLSKLIQNENIKNLNVILVDYFYEEENMNMFSVYKISENEIINGLFKMSCYGEAGNILILNLKKSS